MRIFAAAPGEPVSRDKLVGDLRPTGEGRRSERAVDVQITRLRRKIEADPKQPRYLQTVRGSGYMLAAGLSGTSAGGLCRRTTGYTCAQMTGAGRGNVLVSRMTPMPRMSPRPAIPNGWSGCRREARACRA